MALNPLTGAATTTVKVSDFNAMIAALNAELATLGSRVSALESEPEPVIPPDQSAAVTALEARLDQAQAAIAALESEPDPVLPPDLTTRVEALENLIVRSPAEGPGPGVYPAEPLPRPAKLPADEVVLVYDKATLYLGSLEMHADRIGERRWRLYASLNYIVISPAEWAYEEIVEGTPDEVYEHAHRRLQELAELKPQHDAVHDRVKEMSEGRD